jgi:hypothetical protein
MTGDLPLLPVTASLAPELCDALGRSGIEQLGRRLEDTVGGLLGGLGVPGRPSAAVERRDAAPRVGQPVRLSVGGVRCRYPDRLPARIVEAHLGVRLDDGTWRAALGDKPDDLVEVLALLCTEAVTLRPGVLVGLPQAASYAEGLPVSCPPAAWLRDVLGTLLDLRISVSPMARVDKVLATVPAGDTTAAREALIADLRPETLEIRVSTPYLRAITAGNDPAPDGQGRLAYTRSSLFEELGLPLPEFRFVPADDLPPPRIAFKINHLCTYPGLGLAPGQLLVDAEADQIRWLGIEATPGRNPASFQPACVVSVDAPVRNGWTTTNPLDYLLLELVAAIRRHAACLIDLTVTGRLLDALGEVFPALRAAVPQPPAEITALLRNLLAENVSVHNLRRIAERLVDAADSAVSPGPLLEFVRVGLGREFVERYGRPPNAMAGRLMAPEVDAVLTAPGDEDLDLVSAAIAAAVSDANPADRLWVLLTAAPVRPALARLLGAEFPHMRAISLTEVDPRLHLEILGHIGLPRP